MAHFMPNPIPPMPPVKPVTFPVTTLTIVTEKKATPKGSPHANVIFVNLTFTPQPQPHPPQRH